MAQADTLNKKLAEWAGWHDFNQNGCGYPPDNVKDQPRLFPIFTNSLDACLKWLVPKLQYQTNIKNMQLGWHCMLYNINKEPPRIEAIETTPALALCLAIEKLINEKVKE